MSKKILTKNILPNRPLFGGFSLLEMLVYIAILVLLLVIIINITISVVSFQRSINVQKSIENSAMVSFERMTREVRQADSIDTTSSVFGVSPGILVLNSEDGSGNPRTVEFSLSSGEVLMSENGVSLGSVSQMDTEVTSFILRHFSNSGISGIRIEMILESGTSTHYRSANFYSSVVLR